MSKYFDTKPGSLEEAVSSAQQAAIAISKKEKEKEKNEDKGQFSFVAQKAKEKGDDTFVFAGKKYDTETEELVKETNKNDKSDDGDGLDAVQPKAVKKKFADRKDKDIDNDGDVDDSDKFLHKRRKAVSKSMGEEISQEEFEMMIEILTELSNDTLKRAQDMAKARADKAAGRASTASKAGLSRVSDKESDKEGKARDQETKFARAARAAKERDTEKAMQKGVLGKKGTSAKSVEKSRRKDVAFDAGPGKEKGSVGGVDRNIQKGKDAYDNYVQGQKKKNQKPLSRNDYMKRHGGKLKREDFETDLEFEAHLLELHRTMTPLKDTIVNMWKEAQDMEQDKNGDGIDDDQKPKKAAKKTDSGKNMTPVETSPKMPKIKEAKNKV